MSHFHDPRKSSILFLATVCDLLYFWFLISLKHKQQIQNKLSFVFKYFLTKNCENPTSNSHKFNQTYCTALYIVEFVAIQWYTYLNLYDLFTTQGTTLLFRLLYIVTNRLRYLESHFYLFRRSTPKFTFEHSDESSQCFQAYSICDITISSTSWLQYCFFH